MDEIFRVSTKALMLYETRFFNREPEVSLEESLKRDLKRAIAQKFHTFVHQRSITFIDQLELIVR